MLDELKSVKDVEIELRRLIEDAEVLSKKARLVAYNYERSFVGNVKEISGNGLTAEEAREKWGLQ